MQRTLVLIAALAAFPFVPAAPAAQAHADPARGAQASARAGADPAGVPPPVPAPPAGRAHATPRTESYQPAYVSPAELLALVGAQAADGQWRLSWSGDGAPQTVDIWRDDTANRVVFSGDPEALQHVEALAHTFDTAPRQIQIEARVVEIDTDEASDPGIDWSAISASGGFNQTISRRLTTDYNHEAGVGPAQLHDRQTSDTRNVTDAFTLNNALRLLQQRGAATYREAPTVLTLNNHAATVFDGTHVTHVNRAASHANTYQTGSFDAGLKLEVTPSELESGYLRLQLHAELTGLLTGASASLASTRAKAGQQVDDVVMAKDGQTVLLGGFSHTEQSRVHTRFPLLGTVLPFWFSRDVTVDRHHAIFVAITPRVLALDARPNEDVRRALGDR